MYVRMSANFRKFNSECQGWLGMSQTTPRPPSVRPVDRTWTGSGHVRMSALPLPPWPYARDLQAQGACALQFFKNELKARQFWKKIVKSGLLFCYFINFVNPFGHCIPLNHFVTKVNNGRYYSHGICLITYKHITKYYMELLRKCTT